MKRCVVLIFGLASLQMCLGLEALDCLVVGKPGCIEGHLNQALTRAQSLPTLRITRHLSIISSSREVDEVSGESTTLEKLERYIYGHSLKLELPEELVSGARGLVGDDFLADLPKTIVLPLAEQDSNEGRGFVKKVVLPFLLGLKFKATAVIPLAMALIALKTWKALTLGLLSLVLTAAMIIFRLTRPKTVNYEVYYPHHHHHVDEHYHARAHDLAYRAHA
ncbi:uncharacterized protein LOC106666963 [Cimex lectularius]|uniref:Osiris 18 n=1 Tax=Cimex lectularius TaxID=79782 RepID=A0A8I6RXY4_CIMLE|nr:uncharacterized protein LOC106666963 [Cimex lectularius]